MTINKEGEVIVNVLSSESSLELGIANRGTLEIKEVVEETESGDADIYLENENGKISLTINTAEDQKMLDVTDFQSDLIEFEERNDVTKIKIGLHSGRFSIEQGNIMALTDFSISINSKENEFSLTTPSGNIFLSVLPVEAVESALRSKFISRLTGEKIDLSIKDMGVLAYTVEGEKVLDVFNLFDYEIPVTAEVSAITGEILSINGPEWFKIFGFLFS